MTTEAECPSPEVPVRTPSYTNTAQSSMPAAGAPRVQDDRTDERDEDKGHMGTAMGILIPFGLIVLAAGWIMYAYRNPHTKSGQFLIQVRKLHLIEDELIIIELTFIDSNLGPVRQMNGVKKVHGTVEHSESVCRDVIDLPIELAFITQICWFSFIN